PADTACQTATEQQALLPMIALGETGEATQWKVHQLTLEASQEYTKPYTYVVVTATFNGPAGAEQIVQGFWNGGDEFAVRFTPTAPGDWSYSIQSVPADVGLSQSGSFTAKAASPATTGFLRRDPANPYSFVYD